MKKLYVRKYGTSRRVAVLLDDDDFERVRDLHSQTKFKVYQNGYVLARREIPRNIRTNKKFSITKLHRFIMRLDLGDRRQVDHDNHNKLDNRKQNLKVCYNGENSKNRSTNTSRFVGVHWARRKQKWCAKISLRRSYIWLGYFENEIDAAQVYCRAVVELWPRNSFDCESRLRENIRLLNGLTPS